MANETTATSFLMVQAFLNILFVESDFKYIKKSRIKYKEELWFSSIQEIK